MCCLKFVPDSGRDRVLAVEGSLRLCCVFETVCVCRCGWCEYMRPLAGSRRQCESSHLICCRGCVGMCWRFRTPLHAAPHCSSNFAHWYLVFSARPKKKKSCAWHKSWLRLIWHEGQLAGTETQKILKCFYTSGERSRTRCEAHESWSLCCASGTCTGLILKPEEIEVQNVEWE